MPKLVIAGTTHELVDELITIGRAPDNAIVIDDPSISGRHAHLEASGDTYRIKDLDSTNGTRVNGIPITETVLRLDDRVRFGAIDGRFEAEARGSQPLPELAAMKAQPADMSIAPVDFANASPFRHRTTDKDPTRMAILATALLAILVFLGSMIAVITMHAPVL